MYYGVHRLNKQVCISNQLNIKFQSFFSRSIFIYFFKMGFPLMMMMYLCVWNIILRVNFFVCCAAKCMTFLKHIYLFLYLQNVSRFSPVLSIIFLKISKLHDTLYPAEQDDAAGVLSLKMFENCVFAPSRLLCVWCICGST